MVRLLFQTLERNRLQVAGNLLVQFARARRLAGQDLHDQHPRVALEG